MFFHSIPLEHLEVYSLLKQHMSNMVQGSAYNWVLPSLWSSVFGGGLKQPTKREKVLASTAAVF